MFEDAVKYPYDEGEGLRAIAIGVAYLLLPALLVGAAVAAFLVPIADPVPRAVSLVAAVVALLSVPLLLAALYVLPAGLARFAVTGEFGSAFAFRRLWPVLRSGTYAVAWLLALVVTVVAGAVGGIVGGLTLVGFVLTAVVVYYGEIVAAYLYARGFTGERPTVTTGIDGDDSSWTV